MLQIDGGSYRMRGHRAKLEQLRASSAPPTSSTDNVLNMPIVEIPMSQITDWDSFHDAFAKQLGFPEFYGRNMNAWIDCLTYEDDGMTAHPVDPGDVLTLQLVDCRDFRTRCHDIYEALIDSSAFVNWRRIELGEPSILALSYR